MVREPPSETTVVAANDARPEERPVFHDETSVARHHCPPRENRIHERYLRAREENPASADALPDRRVTLDDDP